MWLCVVLILLQMLALSTNASCSASDWQTLIGNPDFNIMSTYSDVNSQGDILVAGLVQIKHTNAQSAFIYLLRTSDCTVPWRYQIKAITNQVHSITWSFDESYAYIIGIGQSDEYLAVV